ncbi:heparan-alpha-glucosaminide N-acetyltransferase domain-containing protein [Demequina mangrovi]|nr:heparan-alpha-glucosaminide N-acetyltransferase domain-containing protein [Demequina mangrovi]
MGQAAARIVGLDLARGVAVIGMVAAHVGADASDPGGWAWLAIAHGRPSALFAVLLGVTMAVMVARAGGRSDARGVRRTRARIAARAVLLVLLGLVLAELGTAVDIVLVNLGLLMLMAVPLLRAPSWVLLTLAGAAFALGLVLVEAVRPEGWWYSAPVIGRLWSLHYPALAWIGYTLVGLAIGRLALERGRTQLLLVALGVVGAAGALAVRIVVGEGAITDLGAHSYTPLEMTANTAVAAAVIGASCWIAPRLATPLGPVIALGSMALSGYVLHVLVIDLVGNEMVYEPSNVALVVLVAAMLAAAWAWRRWLGQGPLERALTSVSNTAGELVAPAPAGTAPR